MIGTITLNRRDAERPGHVRLEAGEAELGYMFLPEAWGCGYATEACAAALDWFAGALPSEPVVLCTQVANDRSMRLAAKLGFTEVERFEEYGAEQWFGVWSSVTPFWLSSSSTARRIHDDTERIVAHFTTITPTSDRRAHAPVSPLIGTILQSVRRTVCGDAGAGLNG